MKQFKLKLIVAVIFVISCVSIQSRADWQYSIEHDPFTVDTFDLNLTNTPPELPVTLFALSSTATDISPEIRALSGALKHDPVSIYNYVRNNIEWSPFYGVRNGANGCLLAGKGSDADQACLLSSLLADSGYDVRLRKGLVFYEIDDLTDWYGVDSKAQLTNAVGRSGNYIYDWPAHPTWWGIFRIWTEVDVNGTWYKFDPAYTKYYNHADFDLENACGFNMSTFMSAALTGSSYDANYVQNVDSAVITTKLELYSANLKAYIETNIPNVTVAEILGGRTRRIESITELPTSLPDAKHVDWVSSWVPESEAVQINIQHAGINETVASYQIAGKRISITYDAQNGYRPVLRIGGDMIETGNTTTPGTANNLYISVNHPYLWETVFNCDTNYTLKPKSGDTYLLAHNFSRASKQSVASANRQLGAYFIDELSTAGESILGESMFNVMESGLTQWMGTQDVLSELCELNIYPYHFFGLMKVANGGSYYVDLSAILSATASRTTSSDIDAWKKANSLGASGLEHSVLEQAQGADNPAVSTVKLLKISNASGKKTFFAHSGNWNSGFNVKNRLHNYTNLSEIEAAIGQGFTFVLPEYANITLDDWTGIGYVKYGSAGFGMMIAGDLNGGYSANSSSSYSPPAVQNVIHTVYAPPTPAQVDITASFDPVNLFSGSLLFDKTDLVLGNGGVRGLAYSRHYNSAQRAVDSTLGHGWRHSYDITATEISDASVRFGSRQTVDSIPIIIQNYVNSQLMSGSPEAKEWVASCLVTQWGTEQLIDNAVHIRMGNRSLEYVLQPDGTYVPPAGVTTELSENNGAYQLTERFGKTYQFNVNGTIGNIEDADGNTMTFAYNSQTNLQTVTDCYGRTLTFDYNSSDYIHEVTDSTGRTVEYAYNLPTQSWSRDADTNWLYFAYDNQHQLISITDSKQTVTVSNIYNDVGQVVTQYNAYGEAWDFHCGGYAAAEITPLADQATHYFDDNGRNLGTENALGNRTYKSYDAHGHIITNIDANAENTILQYDADHNLTNRIDALGKEWVYEYDSSHHLTAKTDPLGNTTRYQYDSEHHVTSVSNELGETTTTYTGAGLPHTVTTTGAGLPSARLTTYSYDQYGNPETITSTDGGTITNTWNVRGELTIARDSNGNETSYTYNNRGLVTIITDDNSNTINHGYDTVGNRTSTTDKRGNATSYSYTPTYKIQSVTYPDTSTISNSYDSADRLTSTTDGEGNTTSFVYDSAGRRISVTDDLNHSNRYALDPNGNILAVTNAIDHATHNAVDALNRITNRWDTVGSQTRRIKSEFDTAGRQTAAVNPLDQRTEYAHDTLGRVTTTTRPDQATENNMLDALGNLLSYTNAKDTAIVSTTYDGQSRPLTQTNALDNGKSWTYDNVGNQLTRTDANGDTTQYAFDNLNRIESVQYPDSTGAGFTYDENSNLMTATNKDANLSFVYDTMNRITTVNQSVLSVSSVVGYSYNNNGQRTSITYPDSEAASYTYDDANRLTALSSTLFASDFAFSYNDANQLTGITYPNGVTATYTRDTGGRLTGTKYANGATTHIDRDYEYNALGQITKRTITAGLEAVPSDTHRHMRHNAADQLTHVSRMDNYENPEQWRDVGQHYDQNGSTTNMAVKYNGMNLTSTFGWDYDGRLTSYSGEHQTNLWFTVPPLPVGLTWKYDALGGRITRHGETGGEKIHVLDQAATLKNVLVQTSTSGTIERYYIYAPGFGLVAHVEANGTVVYYHGDLLGSTIALTDLNGNVTDQFAYTPYGELMAHTGTTETPYTFCGRYGVYWEGGALYHMKHRYYRADIARFISSDPIGISGGVNLYAYAMGNPILFLDALGLCSQSYYDDPGYPTFSASPPAQPSYSDAQLIDPTRTIEQRQYNAAQYAPGSDASSYVGLIAAEQHGNAIGTAGAAFMGSTIIVEGATMTASGAAMLSDVVDRTTSYISAWQPASSTVDQVILHYPNLPPERASVGDMIYQAQPVIDAIGSGIIPGPPNSPLQSIPEVIGWGVGSELSPLKSQ